MDEKDTCRRVGSNPPFLAYRILRQIRFDSIQLKRNNKYCDKSNDSDSDNRDTILMTVYKCSVVHIIIVM